MADRYLQEDHAFAIARNVHSETTRVNPEPDERTSWVMLSRSGSLVRLPDERIIHTTNARVSLDVSVPKSLQGRTATPFTLKSDNGTAYITNQRVSTAKTREGPIELLNPPSSTGNIPPGQADGGLQVFRGASTQFRRLPHRLPVVRVMVLVRRRQPRLPGRHSRRHHESGAEVDVQGRRPQRVRHRV